MANPPKWKEIAMKLSSPQSKKRVSVGARTSTKGKTATKSPVKCSRAGTRSTHNIPTVETQSTHVDPILETSLQAVPSIGTSEPNAISLADLSRKMVQAAQEKGIAVPRMDEIEAEYKKHQANQGAANPWVTHLLPTLVSVAFTHIPCSLAIICNTTYKEYPIRCHNYSLVCPGDKLGDNKCIIDTKYDERNDASDEKHV